MKIGMTLPAMVRDYDRQATLDWCKRIDEGPFSSLAVGERITYFNQDMIVLMAAAAALTERVDIYATLFVLPLHGTGTVAKQIATMDVLSGGRLRVGVGVGGREHDFKAAEREFSGRHKRMDAQVAAMRDIWNGGPAFEGADPIGPAPIQKNGPPILAGVMGAKPLARAANWADGVCGQAMDCNFGGTSEMVRTVQQAWNDAGRDTKPFTSTCFWYGLGPDGKQRLYDYADSYAAIFGPEIAKYMADNQTVSDEASMLDAMRKIQDGGVDELVLVPTSSDLAELDRTLEVMEKL